jgi:hypothetical protein
MIRRPLVGSRTGAVPVGSPWRCPPFPASCPIRIAVGPSPVPARSNGACGFPALRFPVRFAPWVMGPIDPERFRPRLTESLPTPPHPADSAFPGVYCPVRNIGDSPSRTAQSGGESDEGRRSAPLAFGRFPGCGRLCHLPCSSAFAVGGGFLQLLDPPWSPCRPYHPAEVPCGVGQAAACHAVFAPDQGARPSEFTFLEAAGGLTRVTAR